jgi:hypothetical protein
MKNNFLKYIYKTNISIGLTLVVLSIYYTLNIKYWGCYLIFNGLSSLVLFYVNGKPLWMGMGGFNYGMEKLFKVHYNRYLNLTMGIICLILGVGIVIAV